MWTIEEEKAKKLGDLLIKYRVKYGYTSAEVSIQTMIDPAQLSRLEKGTVYRINPFMLKSLAKLYKVDVISFYEIIDYI